MVRLVVSRYTASPPSSLDAGRKIAGGPLYGAQEVLSLLDARGDKALKAWTRKCVADLQKWELDLEQVIELLRTALSAGTFIGSVWCKQRPSGPWAACDSYRVFRSEWVEAARKNMMFEYYLKFAIAKTGSLLLLVSCHPSEDRS